MPNSTPTPTILPITQLQPNPLQPRGKIIKEQLDELVQSVKNYGILEPIIVAHTPAGYQIIAGERRWRAAKAAGLQEVPVIVKNTTPKGMLEMAIIENVQRLDLSAIERAQAFQQLMRDFKYTQNQISEKVGKSLAYVSNTVRMLNLPDAIKDGLASGIITEGHARAIAGIEDERSMIECYKIILKEGASVRRAEELARRFKEAIGQTVAPTGKKTNHNAEIDQWQNALQNLFSSERAKVKLVRSARQTKVTFVFTGTIEQTQAELEKIVHLVQKN